ncbi:MAG: signal recognition particle-docking protein FtsY [Clostridia bacterium]|nr:signal recognition particle-docking protein FtsY [Clostridia bacterium]MBR4954448.1 signal recognition particle-docking protein FtsY [Clostridia bacterium]MBR5902834.1 signal recognition particle-docking protein FtsY [Clostridia bacterium]
MGFYDKIKAGLKKTKENANSMLNAVFATFRQVDEDTLEELEEALIAADLGATLAFETVEEVRREAKLNKINSRAELSEVMSRILAEKMTENRGLQLNTKPSVILVLGVNGVGKTTSIGKIGTRLVREGKKVLFAAGDTFRAAAADQLSIWASRSGSDIVRHAEGADPSAVIFDAISAAKARGADVVICDTAGRLHNKANLMNELSKMARVIRRELPDADVETLLVLDATTGQNALIQAEAFNEVAELTGLVITKLDGTAKGGIAINISAKLNVPVKLIGVGEGQDDLIDFDPADFTKAFFE